MNLNSSSRPTKILLIGASGFIGSRIFRALQARSDVLISILARRPSGFFSLPALDLRMGDVTDQRSVQDAVRGADVVINAASYVGSDPKVADHVNHVGTLSVIQACKRSSVRKLVLVSSAAVYGPGPHRALEPWEAQLRPESAVSRSRAAADMAVLSAGGIVVRPNLIYGAGDRWFIPRMIRMFQALGTSIDDGKALLSTIDVADLGLLVAALAVTSEPSAGVYHAARQTPIRLNHLLSIVNQHIAPLNIKGSSSVEEAVDILKPAGFSPHQVQMLGMDHYYQANELWNLAGIPPTGMVSAVEARAWYRGEGRRRPR